MNENICYFYYRDENRKPIVTIAYRRNLKENAVLFGAAFWNKKDKLTKQEGRVWAERRLNETPAAIALSEPNLPRFDVHDAILQYLENVYEYGPKCFSVREASPSPSLLEQIKYAWKDLE